MWRYCPNCVQVSPVSLVLRCHSPEPVLYRCFEAMVKAMARQLFFIQVEIEELPAEDDQSMTPGQGQGSRVSMGIRAWDG
jgi:hypothetical protein